MWRKNENRMDTNIALACIFMSILSTFTLQVEEKELLLYGFTSTQVKETMCNVVKSFTPNLIMEDYQYYLLITGIRLINRKHFFIWNYFLDIVHWTDLFETKIRDVRTLPFSNNAKSIWLFHSPWNLTFSGQLTNYSATIKLKDLCGSVNRTNYALISFSLISQYGDNSTELDGFTANNPFYYFCSWTG